MRKMITCNACNKNKEHFGYGKCSACLRLHKRQNKASYYLGTCYSEISRRVKTKDSLRPNYYGLEKCSKEEFFKRFLNDRDFLQLFKTWRLRGFKRGDAPSIDRIDNKKGYVIDNIRFIEHRINSVKEDKKRVYIRRGICTLVFESQKDMADYFNVSPATICKALKLNKFKGAEIGRL